MSLSLRLTDLLGPVTRVTQKTCRGEHGPGSEAGSYLRLIDCFITQGNKEEELSHRLAVARCVVRPGEEHAERRCPGQLEGGKALINKQAFGSLINKHAFGSGGKACLLIRKHDHFTPAREMRRDIKALITTPKGGIIL